MKNDPLVLTGQLDVDGVGRVFVPIKYRGPNHYVDLDNIGLVVDFKVVPFKPEQRTPALFKSIEDAARNAYPNLMDKFKNQLG